jgi:hypothetical protein
MGNLTKLNSIPSIDNATLTFNSLGQLQVNPSGSPTVSSLTATTLSVSSSATVGTVNYSVENPNTAQNTLTGTTAGSIVWSQPMQGSALKLVILYANGYENTTTTAQSITFTKAFTNTPAVLVNTTGMSITVSTTGVTLPTSMTATASGWIIIAGY